MKLLNDAPVEALPMFVIVEESVIAVPIVPVVGVIPPAVRLGSDTGAAHVDPFHDVPLGQLTTRDRVTDVAEPPDPVHVTDCVKVPGVFIAPVPAPGFEVPPRSPFQIPVPEQLVALVELKETLEDCPTVILAGEKELRVTVGAGRATTLW
jgi:hypothetical protein